VERVRKETLSGCAAEIQDVYHRSFASVVPSPTPQEEADLLPSLVRHSERDGFELIAARRSGPGELVGFVYGYRSAPGQYWHDKVTVPLAPGTRQRWFRSAIEIPVLRVVPELQRHGIGGMLIEGLLQGRPEETAVLTALEEDRRAVEFYRRRGWEVLLTGFQFGPHAPRYLLLGRALGN
jgi:ribosomal protein S18 acetylase RimI-like enzyme